MSDLPKSGNSDFRMLHLCVCQGPGNAHVLWVSMLYQTFLEQINVLGAENENVS